MAQVLSPEALKALGGMHDAFIKGLKEQVLAANQQDWEYREIPWCSPEMWELLITGVGAINMVFVSMVDITRKGVPSVRGTCFISPTGMKNLREWAETHKEAANGAGQTSKP